MSYSINVFFKLRNISAEQAYNLIKRLKKVRKFTKTDFSEKIPVLRLSNIKDNNKRILDFVGEEFISLKIGDMSQKKLYELLDSMGELSQKIYFLGGEDLKWSEKFNRYVSQGLLKKEIFTKDTIKKYADYFNKNQEPLFIEELKLKELREIVRKLRKLNNKFLLSRGDKVISILSEKDINYCAEKFIDPVTSGSLKFGDYLIHLITKREGFEGYKFIKPGEMYLGILIDEHYLKYIDDPEDNDYEQRKKERDEDTSKFLNVLKIVYEELKPECGWGDVDVNMESRGFDMKDISRPIIIYDPEQVKKVGENRFKKLPVQAKIKCSDGGYILLIENIGHYTPELREKIEKHLFG